MNILSWLRPQPNAPSLSGVEAREFVAGLYRLYLGREPDTEGWDHYSERLMRGESAVEILHTFATSDEAQERRKREADAGIEASELSPAPPLPEAEARALVGDLYRLFLGREPDADGWDHYTAELTRGHPVMPIVKAFAGSDEARERREREALAFISDNLPDDCPAPNWGKASFLRPIGNNPVILDVGCGNDSPKFTKAIVPDCFYIGLDIGDYNQQSKNDADKYIVVSSQEFAGAIENLQDSADVVISAHNLEHCEDRNRVLAAMCRALRNGGRIYIAFPCADSVDFPKRHGTLNYYDDASHVGEPPDFGEVISILTRNGLRVVYATTRYQPPTGWITGLANEEKSRKSGALLGNSWDFWGFETIIWAERP